MARALRVLMLLVFLGEAAGVDWAGMLCESACDSGCEDDASGKTCPPACPTCTCATRVAPTLAANGSALVVVPTITRLVSTPPPSSPGCPDPREILHVPKPTLA